MRWSLWWLVVLGCGSTNQSGQSSTEAAAGAAGAQSEPSASETAGYRWSECGRIEPSAYVRGANYASDGSVITLEASGRVRLFPSDSNVATTLVADQGADVQTPAPVTLSPDGVWLLLGNTASGPAIYARHDHAPITAGSADLVPVATVDAEGESCRGQTLFARGSGRLATHDTDTACLWESVAGPLLASFELGPGAGTLQPASVLGPDGLLAVRADTLLRFDLTGQPSGSVDLTPLLAATEESRKTSFSEDGQYLALQLFDRSTGNNRLLVLDVPSGELAWQRALTSLAGYSGFVISPDSSALLVSHDALLDLSDGSELGSDVDDLFNSTPVLGPGGRRLLRVGEQVAEWDVEQADLLRLYGSHNQSIRDLDITPDGRHLASHGDVAVTWQLDAGAFGSSLPLFRGTAPDTSWNVALAPDGQVMSVSGDNVMFFKRRGEHWYVGVPPSSAECLSADWSFSPRGGLAAGTHYGGSVQLVDTASLSTSELIGASSCRGGVAFSPDGARLVTASLELFDTTTWTRLYGSPPPQSVPLHGNAEDDVVFSPDGSELVLSRCDDHNLDCTAFRYQSADGTELGELPWLAGEQVRYSPDGHWLVSKATLLHVPTGASRLLPGEPEVAVFTPEGDIVSGEPSGALVRHCREH